MLLETIRIENGKIHNLSYHQQRFDRSQKACFGSTHPIKLSDKIIPPAKGLFRCRILYSDTIEQIAYLPYVPKTIQHIHIVSSNLDYSHKWAERSPFAEMLAMHPGADEILIEKEGLLTDTTIANIAFYDGLKWLTPEKPLLHGTMRQKLLDEGFLQTASLKKEDLDNYTHVALMNAMIGFKIYNLKDLTILKTPLK